MRAGKAMAFRPACASLYALSVLFTVSCAGEPARASDPVPERKALQSPLSNGTAAPDVALTLQDGFALSLAAMRGKPIAVFFCSSLSEPACGVEARALRDNWEELHQKHNLVVVGVTPEPAQAQRVFIAQHKLPFDFASDAEGKLAQAFKVPTRAGAAPHTVLIGRDGKVRATWQRADPEREILAAMQDD